MPDLDIEPVDPTHPLIKNTPLMKSSKSDVASNDEEEDDTNPPVKQSHTASRSAGHSSSDAASDYGHDHVEDEPTKSQSKKSWKAAAYPSDPDDELCVKYVSPKMRNLRIPGIPTGVGVLEAKNLLP
eukprot:scaffold46206_cov65-Attheya_sp.AAC.2